MRERLAGIATPKGRLIAFVEMSIANAPMVAERGCPMGSLTADMLKDDGALAGKANVLLAGPMAWMAEQFAEMGYGADADDLALQLQASLQGASMLAHAMSDAAPLEREGRRLVGWLEQLGQQENA